MSKNFSLIIKEARKLGIQVEIISKKKVLAELTHNGEKIVIKELLFAAQNPLCESVRLAKSKDTTNILWDRSGVPHPKSYFFKNSRQLNEQINQLNLNFPLVYKKSRGKQSIGVHTNIQSYDEAVNIAKSTKGSFILQEMVFGKEYRLLAYGDNIIGALEMVPPHVVGDGKSSIQDLIEKKNISLDKKIIIHEKLIKTLTNSKLFLNSVPKLNDHILLQENSCLAEGGSTVDRTNIVHESIRDLAIKAMQAVNLKLGGIDLICEDISKDANSQKVSFLEINNYPSLSIHHEPTIGKHRNVIKIILKDIFRIS